MGRFQILRPSLEDSVPFHQVAEETRIRLRIAREWVLAGWVSLGASTTTEHRPPHNPCLRMSARR